MCLALRLFTRLAWSSLVQPGPSRVSDSPVSAENVICEAFVLRTNIEFLFIASMKKEKLFNTYPYFREGSKRSTSQFPTKNKGFINYVFCRN